MAFAFLSDTHLERYGRYSGDPTVDQLTDAFRLDPAELTHISTLRHDHTRLGYAVQLCTLRHLGTFLNDPTAVPTVVVQTLCNQLGLRDPGVLGRYIERLSTPYEHQQHIRKALGYVPFEGEAVTELLDWLRSSAQLEEVRPIELFDRCTRRLTQRHVLLPGATVLAKLIVTVREEAAGQLYRDLETLLTPIYKDTLEMLVVKTDGETRTPLEQLKDPPDRISVPALLTALERLEQIRAVGVGNISISSFAESRLDALVRYAEGANAQTLSRLSSARRYATLLIYIQHLEKSATDDVLLMFEGLMASQGNLSERKRRQERLRSLKDLDEAALALREVARVVLDDTVVDGDVRKTALQQVSKDALTLWVTQVGELAIPPGQQLSESWKHALGAVSRFLVPLIQAIAFEGTPTSVPLLAAMKFLTQAEGSRRRSWRTAPKDFIPKSWEDAVYPTGGEPDKPSYLLCVAYRLWTALKGREIFVGRSHKYGDPRGQLLSPEAWQDKKADVCRSLNLASSATEFLEGLNVDLSTQYQETLEHLPENHDVRLETVVGKTTLTLKPLEKRSDSETLKWLEGQYEDRLPAIDLPELLLELHTSTGFLDAFTLASGGLGRTDDLHISMAAVLVSQACNIGLKAVSQRGIPALTLSRLAWVSRNYIRPDTLERSNALLVDAQAKLELAGRWGDGEVASADGMRFVVPTSSIYTRYNRKYFGSQRGITYYNYTSDQFTGFHHIIIPGTVRDSLYILAGLLEHKTSLRIQELMSDTAGSSEIIFGLFHLLGYTFSPRLADLDSVRYWRLDKEVDYGALEGLSKNVVNQNRIAEQWDDVLRLVGSLKLGTVKAPEVMRVLAREGSLSGLGKAVAEIGKVAKTLYLLRYIDDADYRRRIQTQLNRGELRHRVARAVCHGRRGELYQKYQRGLEDQLGALGLVVNAIVLWNTRYGEAILGHLRGIGEDLHDGDISRLSPLKFAHINVLGRYHFEMSPDVAGGDLRPLRDPDSLETLERLWVE